MITVSKLSPQNFKVNFGTEFLDLNFGPLKILIQEILGNEQPFVLVHWQSKPKFIRKFGAYDFTTDSYNPFDWCHCKTEVLGRFVQVSEELVTTVPTAAIWYPNAVFTSLNGFASITEAKPKTGQPTRG